MSRALAWIHFISHVRISSDCLPAVLNWLLAIKVGSPEPRCGKDSDKWGDYRNIPVRLFRVHRYKKILFKAIAIGERDGMDTIQTLPQGQG